MKGYITCRKLAPKTYQAYFTGTNNQVNGTDNQPLPAFPSPKYAADYIEANWQSLKEYN